MTLRIPPVMKHKIELAAEEQGVSENQLALYMLAKELADLEYSKPLHKYWKGKNKKEIEDNFKKVMSKINKLNSDNPIPEWDKI